MGTRAKSAVLSALIALVLALAWHIGTLPKGPQAAGVDPEYAKLMGLDKPKGDGLPTLAEVGATAWKQVSDPFYDAGSNDKGIGMMDEAQYKQTADISLKYKVITKAPDKDAYRTDLAEKALKLLGDKFDAMGKNWKALTVKVSEGGKTADVSGGAAPAATMAATQAK